MKSIKTKLALFVSCLCVVLILLVWLLTVALFEPNYTRKIRKELAAQVSSVATALQSADTGSDAQALFDACYPLVRTGVCVKPRTRATMPEESSPPLRYAPTGTSARSCRRTASTSSSRSSAAASSMES